MKIDRSANPTKVTVVLSEQEYRAIAASLKTSATDRARRGYEYDHHYGLSLQGMKSLSTKFDAAAPKPASAPSSPSPKRAASRATRSP